MILISNDGYFLRFPLEEIPEKKKAAIGVRGMKLNGKALIDQVHFSKNAVESSIEYNGKKMYLSGLAKQLLGKRTGVAGPRYFKYNGEWLNDIRHRLGV